MSKLLVLVLGFVLIGGAVCAQTGSQGSSGELVIYQGVNNIKSEGRAFQFAFAKGDKIVLKLSTEKDKNLKLVRFSKYGSPSTIWSNEKVSVVDQEFRIDEDGVYSFMLESGGLSSKDVTLTISRLAGSGGDYNPAWMKHHCYRKEEISYSVDTMLGYQEPVIRQKPLRVFSHYAYLNVPLFQFNKQILGQAGIHNSQAVGYFMGIGQHQIPGKAKFKCYTYSVSSVLGGAKHWAVADITVQAGAMFLSPAASFAANGAMGLIGPEPGSEPVQYFISTRESDLNTVKEIYSPHNDAKKIIGRFLDDVDAANEGDLRFLDKGKVTNLFVESAKPLSNCYFIMANPEYTQAKNVKLQGSAIFYAPIFRPVLADEILYNLSVETLSKTVVRHVETSTAQPIKL